MNEKSNIKTRETAKLENIKYLPILLFILGLIVTLLVSNVPYPNLMRLSEDDYPNEYVPTLVEAGGNCSIPSIVQKLWIDEQEFSINDGKIEIPEAFEPGWYNLTLQIEGTNNTRKNSLYVTPLNPGNFTFIQVTDTHTPIFMGSDVEERKNVYDLVNDMGPAFIVDTGDMTDYGLEEQYINYEYIISDLEMPLYTVPGNMETYSDPNLDRYAAHLGPANYYFKFNDTLFVAGAALHAPRSWGGFTDEQIEFIDGAMAKDAELKFLLHHIPIVSEEGRDYSLVPWSKRDGIFSQVDRGFDEINNILSIEQARVLTGHWHTYSNEFEYNDVIFYNTPSVVRMSGNTDGPRFRLFRIEDNVIKYDKVISYERLSIHKEYVLAGTEAVISIQNDHDFSIPLNLHLKLAGSPPFVATQGEVVKNTTSGDIWVSFNAPNGYSEFTIH
ncbi:MAG: hypothetical protein GF364_02315 [Candidatus Lokiarchaeota archaeon]|nr:hypothetical protein [Candidatus Lokiarchaeota archaeon]